jgi:hypothetical protein
MSQTSPTSAVDTRRVSAGRGLSWWSEAFSWMFGDLSRLAVWVAMGLFAGVCTSLLHLVPIIGSIAGMLLWFVLTGGMMVAGQKTAQGQVARFEDLFSAFGPKAGALVGVGLLLLVAGAIVWGLMLVVGVGALFTGLFVGLTQPGSGGDPLAAFMGLGGTTFLVLLLLLFLFVPISMAAWLAPALVVLRDARPVDALRMSLSACWHNAGALTVYGIAFVFLALAATLVFLIGWLFLLPLISLSTYAAYRDLFETDIQVLDADPAAHA